MPSSSATTLPQNFIVDLQKTADIAFLTSITKYEKVTVLLLAWEGGAMADHEQFEARMLRDVFNDYYGFSAEL
jgi:hypothetical protein